MLTRFCLFISLTLSAIAAGAEPQTLDLRPIKQWLAHQDKIHSISADFTQTRAFHSLKDPLVSKGHFWFVAPGSFRWEMGDPPKMIAVKKKDVIYLIQPAKKKAERFLVEKLQQQGGPAMFKFPLAKDFEDFQRQFEVRALTVEGSRCHAEVVPKDPATRKFLTEMKFDFETSTGKLFAMEMRFKEGSSMRNEFSGVQINPRIDPATFNYELTDFQVTDGRP